MAAHKPVEWVQAVITRFDEQLPIKVGHQNTHTKVSTEHNKECLINISKYKFSLVISGLTTILKNVNNMVSVRAGHPAALPGLHDLRVTLVCRRLCSFTYRNHVEIM
nr:neurofibromin-like [Labrus bergylta]XP_020516506.1 neurofibromin-like [Labrus bergylta]